MPVTTETSAGDSIGSDAAVIEVSVRELDQLFDSMDPSPFHERDLDRSAHEYILSTAKELSAKEPVALVVYLCSRREWMWRRGCWVKRSGNISGRQAILTGRHLREQYRRGWISLIIGLALLIASVIIGEHVARKIVQEPLATVVRESLLIGGWVAMWRPMDFFLYEWWMIRSEMRVYQRLSQLPVRIIYKGRGIAGSGSAIDQRQRSGRETRDWRSARAAILREGRDGEVQTKGSLQKPKGTIWPLTDPAKEVSWQPLI